MILVGGERGQRLLLEIFRAGEWQPPSRFHIPVSLIASGLIEQIIVAGRRTLILSPRHPAGDELRAVLRSLNGGRLGTPPAHGPIPRSEWVMDDRRPLGHQSHLAFRVLSHLLRLRGDVTLTSLRWSFPDARPPQINAAINELTRCGVLRTARAHVAVVEKLPAEFYALVQHIARIVHKRQPATIPHLDVVPRVAAHQRAADMAPLLFGTDIRLRNLMGLAKYGAAYVSELSSLTGVYNKQGEDADDAPFGRSGAVVTWEDEHGVAVALDPAYPLALPLRRLLLKLEERYNLPPLRRRHTAPSTPRPRRWAGDRHALFGGPVKAHILYTIGALGWTFEALCVRTATGHDRVVVKKALAMLHHEGILESARDPRPGFDVRLITIARSFPAADELDFLLRQAVKKWPGIGRTALHAVSTLPTKTKHHLENLGVLPADEMELASGRRRFASAREDCLDRYYALVETSGVPIPSQTLLKRDSTLYRAIRKAWPSFVAFRKDAGLPDPQNGHTRQPCPELRDRCIREYFALARELRALPTSAGVVARRGWLYQLIVIQWGGFPQFCEDLEIRPAGVQAPKRSPEEKRARCYDEYAILCRRIGRLLSASQLREHDSRLHKRIVKLWGAMGTFQRDFEAADFGL